MTVLQNPPHILVVDDDEEVRALIAEYLGQGGLQVSLAGDADEARRVLMAKSIDLAVVDLVMPGENGLSLTRFIRERLEIGVVMLTSADDPVDRIVGLAVGADDYLAKPFHPRELLDGGRPSRTRPTPVSASCHASIVRYGSAGATLRCSKGSDNSFASADPATRRRMTLPAIR